MFHSIGRVIDSWRHATSTETGHQEEVFSIMMPSLSWCGLTRKINWELFPCSQELVLLKFSIDSAEPVLTSKQYVNLLTMNISDTLPHAQQILEQPWEHQYISSSQNWWRIRIYSTQLPRNTTFKLEVFMVSTLKLMTEFSIFQTEEDSEDQKRCSSKIWLMVSKPLSLLRRPKPHEEIKINTVKIDCNWIAVNCKRIFDKNFKFKIKFFE